MAPIPSNVVAVAEALREAIVGGRLRSGDRIKEQPLARQLGVSRGPIRDALRLLEADGLVEIIPNRGAIVPEVRADDVLEVYAIRAGLGSLALHKLLIDGPASLAPIDRALDPLRGAVASGDAAAAAEADLHFQEAIVAGASMPRLERDFRRLSWQVRMFIATLDIDYGDKLRLILDEVEGLAAAIAAGQADKAERLWRAKCERWVKDLVGHLPGGEEFDQQLWVALTIGPPPARGGT